MKNLFFINFFIVFITIFFTSCEKAIPPVEENKPPTILSVTSDKTSVYGGEEIKFYCTALDPDGDPLYYEWNDVGVGTFLSNGSSSTVWRAPNTESDFIIGIGVFVGDGQHREYESIMITVLSKEEEPNPEPEPSYYIKYVTDDTYVSEDHPDKNYGDELFLSTGKGNYTYLKFNIEDIFDYIQRDNLSSIEKVEISLYVAFNNTLNKPVGTAKMYEIPWGETLWFENLITYNKKPSFGDKIAEVSNITFEKSDVVSFDVKKDFLKKVQLHDNYSVMIHTPSPTINASCSFYSKELKENHPEYGDSATPVLWIKYK